MRRTRKPGPRSEVQDLWVLAMERLPLLGRRPGESLGVPGHYSLLGRMTVDHAIVELTTLYRIGARLLLDAIGMARTDFARISNAVTEAGRFGQADAVNSFRA